MEENNKTKGKSNRKKSIIIATIFGTMVTSCIIGGYNLNKDKSNDFVRTVQEDGSIELDGLIDYDTVKDFYVIEIKTIINEHKIFLGKEKIGKYIDVFTGKRIYSGLNNTELIKSTLVEDYLIAFDMLKEKYSEEDLRELLSKIEENHEFEEDKQYVKER